MCLDDANFICRYRNALCSRPKNQLIFPSGQLLTTNTRSSGLSISKYAKDYFILYIFLHGEKSCIKDIFGKNKNDPIFTEMNKVTEAELKTTIQSIIERIVDLEKTRSILRIQLIVFKLPIYNRLNHNLNIFGIITNVCTQWLSNILLYIMIYMMTWNVCGAISSSMCFRILGK